LVAGVTVDELQAVLTERRGRLAALPGVVGWGVGIGADGDPTIQLFVSGPPSDGLVAEVGRLLDRFEFILQCGPAEADSRGSE
jgi:hypothetical protein